MANPRHLKLLDDSSAWAEWQCEGGEVPDLRGASLTGRRFAFFDLEGARLDDADLSNADLSKSHLSKATLTRANLTGANLTSADLRDVEMYHAVLEGACLAQANLGGATLSGSTLRSADLREADFTLADLSSVKFDGSDLSNANLQQTDLDNASLQNANLCNASLFRANLTDTNLSASDLTGANLNEARLVRTILTASTLSKSHIYGVAAWDVKLEQTRQLDLVISRRPFITVDDLELAQFVYLLLNNSKLKNVIGTITSKTVLILGRFTEPRKRILDALRRELRGRNYIPIVFDFVPSEDRSLTETIQLLANMARFVIADVTAAKSIPQELSHIVPFLPSVAVQPIILSSESEFALFEHWQRFNSVLPVFRYDDESHLLASLESQVIGAAENWTSDRNENQRLREEIKRLQAQLPSH